MNSFDNIQAEDFYSEYQPTPQDLRDMQKAQEQEYDKLMAEEDLRRAKKLQKEYGRQKWLISWSRDENLDMWAARVSCPAHEETFEAISDTICGAISNCTSAILQSLTKN